MLTRIRIQKDYQKIINKVRLLYNSCKYEQLLALIKLGCRLMYSYNLVFNEPIFEDILIDVAEKKFKINSFIGDPKTVLFYDDWGLETRGLTNQYIRGLLANNYTVVLVTYDFNKNHMQYLQDLFSKTKSKIVYLNNKKRTFDIVNDLIDIYEREKPSKVFHHAQPDDVTAFLFFCVIKNSERFLVNLTDHAFWLGVKCVDYIIEYRAYGYSISKALRGIDEDKLKILPYYPIIKSYNANFVREFFSKHKKVIVSGGSLYKINGSDVFFETVKYILTIDTETVFVFIGNGDKEKFIKFIHDNDYDKRCFLFDERPDYIGFIENCYFYLNTYPVSGGLMTQIPVVLHKIPISLCEAENNAMLQDTDIRGLFVGNPKELPFLYDNYDKMLEDIGRILKDKGYKNYLESKLLNLVLTKQMFDDNLEMLISMHTTGYTVTQGEVALQNFSDICICSFSKDYNALFLSAKNFTIYFMFIGYILKAIPYYFMKRICG